MSVFGSEVEKSHRLTVVVSKSGHQFIVNLIICFSLIRAQTSIVLMRPQLAVITD